MIKHANKSDLVFEELREMIYSGDLAPGETVSAMEIASRLGVSRTPVNEAVKRLSDRKLVELLPKVGFRIISLPLEDVIDLQYLKMTYEQMALEWIRDRKIGVDIEQLRSLNQKIREAAEAGQKSEYNESVRNFHLAFVAAAQSRTLLESFSTAWEYSGWEDTRLQEISPELALQCEEHDQELDYIEAGEFEAALTLARRHGELWIERFKQNSNNRSLSY